MFLAAVLLVLAACTKQDFEPATGNTGELEFRNGGLTGAIYTTKADCMDTNENIYAAKDDVYLNGGPRGGGSGLPDGFYYVQVTSPNGEVLGKTNDATVEVVGGRFVQCYQLSAILFTTSSGYTAAGYDDTSNPGGEYKVWVSPSESFPNRLTKTDNFKVKPKVQPPKVRLDVLKYYDANANGMYDAGETLLEGWKVNIQDYFGFNEDYFTPVSIELDPASYIITEYMPAENTWMPTTPTVVEVELTNSPVTVRFGNLCLGGGNGRTLGFWSNRNGQAIFVSTPPAPNPANLAYMVSRNLRNANGSHFDPLSYTAFRSWLLGANATNMSYMLSAQMAAMALNVNNGLVAGNALIYAPGATSANALGFATVNAVLTEANAELGMYGNVPAGHERRSYQEALKNALDNANNNLNFVQAQPCPFSFPVEEEEGE